MPTNSDPKPGAGQYLFPDTFENMATQSLAIATAVDAAHDTLEQIRKTVEEIAADLRAGTRKRKTTKGKKKQKRRKSGRKAAKKSANNASSSRAKKKYKKKKVARSTTPASQNVTGASTP
jgi:hypothetical protein